MKPSTHRVLTKLRQAGADGATTAELCQPDVGGARFGARIAELRKDGFAIENVRERQGSDRYWLRYDIERQTPVATTDTTPATPPAGASNVVQLPAPPEGAHIPGLSYCSCDACQQLVCEAPASHELALIPPATAAGQMTLVGWAA